MNQIKYSPLHQVSGTLHSLLFQPPPPPSVHLPPSTLYPAYPSRPSITFLDPPAIPAISVTPECSEKCEAQCVGCRVCSETKVPGDTGDLCRTRDIECPLTRNLLKFTGCSSCLVANLFTLTPPWWLPLDRRRYIRGSVSRWKGGSAPQRPRASTAETCATWAMRPSAPLSSPPSMSRWVSGLVRGERVKMLLPRLHIRLC